MLRCALLVVTERAALIGSHIAVLRGVLGGRQLNNPLSLLLRKNQLCQRESLKSL